MKFSTFISGSLALALAATSVTPTFAAPVSPANNGLRSSVEQVQYRKTSEEEEQLRRHRRGEGERRLRDGDGQRQMQLDDPRQPRRGEGDRQYRQPQTDAGRIERRRDGDMRRAERGERREMRQQNRFERRGDMAYFNGHRGYRERRHGYRYYEGFWFPPAAFLLGAIIASQPGYRNSDWQDHVDWCYDRYGNRYRERDNTYISRSGYRRECVSPYY